MLNEIIQGDNGTVLDLTIQDDNGAINITNTSIEVIIRYRDYRILKQAQITDAENGKCRVVLSSADIQNDGAYYFQTTVTFADGKLFSSNIQRFNVGKKIGYTPNPPPIGGGNGNFSNVTDSTINGNIIVNGIQLQVYDDQLIKLQLEELNIYKALLSRLGISVNGVLTIDGNEITIPPSQTNSIDGGTFLSSVFESIIDGGEFTTNSNEYNKFINGGSF